MRMRVRWTYLWIVAIGLLCVALPLGPVAHAQDKSLVWERFDVDITVNTDGTFDVAEHQQIRFTSGSFSFGYRDIPIHNLDYIDHWAVTDAAGHTYTEAPGSKDPYTFTVDNSNGHYIVHWYFPSMSNSADTYTLSYRVHGGLRYYEKGDMAWWKAIYADRSFPVLAGHVRVIVPAAAKIQQWAAYINSADARKSATANVMDNGQAVLFELGRTLQTGEDFEVRVEFTPGVVQGTAPAWQKAADAAAAQQDAAIAFRNKWGPVVTLAFVVLTVLLVFGGPALLYVLWYRLGRDKPTEMVADYLPEPPDNLAPGMAGTLLDETVDMEDIIATIVDLARRKAISITEEKQEGFFHSGTDFIYRREHKDVELLPFERKLLNDLFGHKDEVRLSDLKQKFYSKLDGIKSEMYKAVVSADLFPRDPNAVRNQYGCLGGVGLAVAAGVGMGLSALFGTLTGAAALPGFGLGVVALGLLMLARYMPRKTDHGAEEAAKWNAFKTYLRHIDKYSDLESQKEIWDRWLPYAIAFGIDKQYIHKFEKVQAPAPGWYIPSPALYGPYHRQYYGPGGGGHHGRRVFEQRTRRRF